MSLNETVRGALLGLGLMLAGAMPAMAAGDSSADAAPGFKAVQASTAVVIRVPINEKGEELTGAAEMRLHSGADLGTSGDFKAAFGAGTTVSNQSVVSKDDIARDSSTHGWYGNGYGYGNSCGWQTNYFFFYLPSYYNCGSYYSYHQPYYEDSCHEDHDYYGYRYYYYPRGW